MEQPGRASQRRNSNENRSLLRSLTAWPAPSFRRSAPGHARWLRGSLGAKIAVGASALFASLLLGPNSADLPWLVAPLGASAVLVFAVPASPLAQPWPLVGGTIVSAIIGLPLGMYAGSALLAASLAVGLSIAVMSLARCLHPPGGACALLCALGAAGPDPWTWSHLLPIAANVLTLAPVGWLFNTWTGHPWPHHAVLPHTAIPGTARHTRQDIEDVLANWTEVLDVDVDDLDAFCQALDRKVATRRARRQ